MGIGLIYPLFSCMLFDPMCDLLPSDTSPEMRGMHLGILLALMPLVQFFVSPIWGALSDSKGRKKTLSLTVAIALIGYLVAFLAILFHQLFVLFASRILIGVASGNIAIVQATIADLSTKEEKAAHFGLFGMFLGIGFMLGPFLGGLLSTFGYFIPFLFAFALTLVNLFFVVFFFKETNQKRSDQKVDWKISFKYFKQAFCYEGLRTIFLCSFLHNLGWSYFFEFVPVYLIAYFQFSSSDIGLFYGAAGSFYALSAGLLIRPLVKYFKVETLFFGGNVLTACMIFVLPLLPSSLWLWPLLFLICYFVAFATPSSTAYVSNNSDENSQGQALGILSAVNAAAYSLSPLLAGSLVGTHPTSPMIIGGLILLFTSIIIAVVFQPSLFKRVNSNINSV